MLARIRAGGRRFITAASGPCVMLVALLRMYAGVLRDLDLTDAYGIEAACLRKGQRRWRRPDSGQPSLSPS